MICEALSLVDIKRNGTTKPLVIDGECECEDTSPRKQLLVKANGLPRITDLDLYCELLGNLLAREFGIETPEPCLVKIDEAFVKATLKPLWEESLKLKTGLGVGCEYFSAGFTVLKSEMHLSKEKLDQAVMIYGFDLLTQNPDRRETNPNCALKGDKIVAFDFEKSLSFLYPIIGEKPEPWEFSKLKFADGDRHIFKSNLKAREKEINWQPFIEKLKQINKQRLEDICSLIPTQFGNHTASMVNHFALVNDKIGDIELELQRSLL